MSKDDIPAISIIIATLGTRTKELQQLLDSLVPQISQADEIILVDQSNSTLDHLLTRYPDVIQIVSEKKGISFNRNIGINTAKGEILVFPDDDCVASPDYISQIREGARQLKKEIVFAFGNILTIDDGRPFHPFFKAGKMGKVNNFNCLFISSASLVFNKSAFQSVGSFDPQFGVGATFGAAEEVDFLLRLIRVGLNGIYLPNLVIHHPLPPTIQNDRIRHFTYAYSLGALARKHWKEYQNWRFLSLYLYSLVRSLGGSLISLMKGNGDFKFHLEKYKAKVAGYRDYVKDQPIN